MLRHSFITRSLLCNGINDINRLYCFFQILGHVQKNAAWYKSMPDDHSKLVPPLPIPNRTVKQLCADDSAATSVKVGYRQASYMKKPTSDLVGFFSSTAYAMAR